MNTRQLEAAESDGARKPFDVARSHRANGRAEAALEILERIVAESPADAQTHQELGAVHEQLGSRKAAIRCYRWATTLNPALLRSWKALAALHAAEGDPGQSARAAEQAKRLSSFPVPLLTVAMELYDGKVYSAEQRCRSFLQKNPRNVEGMRLLANIGMRLGILDDAEFLLESCLVFEPSYIAARYDYVRVLHKRQKFSKALTEARSLLKVDPDNPLYKSMFAAESLALGDFDTALRIYDEVVESSPTNAHAYLHRGHAFKTVGQPAKAIDSYRRACRLKPDFGDAYWSLANLKTYRFDDAELERMLAAETAPETSLVDRYHLCFSLGKAYEFREEFDNSFRYYELGNRLKRSEIRYRQKRIAREAELQQGVCRQDFLAERKGEGYGSNAPIFIVGLPRAGSTLLEQILASHPDVEGTLELPNILSLAHRLNGRQSLDTEPRYPAILRDLDGATLRQLGRQYIEDTRIHRTDAPYFVDKMPNNFRHIGLIRLILPNARIIDARRDPMACCFSCYQQLFAEGQEFTYDLLDIGNYYRMYVELMDHWNSAMPGEILQVRYEDVVMDLESQVRRLLDFCELPFDGRCLRFHQTDRAVRTASSEQVRQPLYRHGIEHWRNYEAHLAPLRHALGDK